MGEGRRDRDHPLEQLAARKPHPESAPINLLVCMKGTPLANQEPVGPLEMVRLSAGRLSLSDEAQVLCLLAGANSIFIGDKLLTTPNPEKNADAALLGKVKLQPVDANFKITGQ